MKIENSTLPWERVTRSGYGQLDLKCVIGGTSENPTTMFVKRLTPGEEHAGKFVVLLEGARISENHHSQRPDAMAEAERFVYDQPAYEASSSGAAVKTALAMGRQAIRDGLSIYQNPFAQDANPVDRSLWVQGYLEAFGAAATAKAIHAAEQTARANAQLESDIRYMTASNRLARLAINFAANIANKGGDGKSAKAAVAFLVEWATSNEIEAFYAKYPDWKAYRDNDPTLAKLQSPAAD